MAYVLAKYKNPVEYAFYQWINAYPEEYHPNDMERFMIFVRTVHAFNATKWKDVNYLRKRIIKEKPNFSEDRLSELIDLYEDLLFFCKISPLPRIPFTANLDSIPEDGHYFELGVKDGEFYKKEVPITKDR